MSLLLALEVSAQPSVTGVVATTDGGPIEFATIQLEGTAYGTLSGAQGMFSLRCQAEVPTSTKLLFSYLGYAPQAVELARFRSGDTIFLRPASYELSRVVVTDRRRGKAANDKLAYGIRNPYFYYQKNIESTYQIASRVPNPNQLTGFATELKFKVGKVASREKSIRLNFFALDPACDCPGAPLHNDNIFVDLRPGWNKIDLEAYVVEVPATDFYVAFEWLASADKKARQLDFSIGMIPVRSAYPLLEKVGGLRWAPVPKSSASRVLTELVLLKE